LLKCGDTWTDDFGQIKFSGKSASEPALISSYGTGARPIIRTATSYGSAMYTSGAGGGGSGGNYIAVIGLEIYAYTRDPGNGSFDKTTLSDTAAVSWLNNFNWLLFEDNKISYYLVNMDIAAFSGRSSNLQIRRNVIHNAYSGTISHAAGAHVDSTDIVMLEENLFHHNGWSAELTAATAVTITQASPGVVTWPAGITQPPAAGSQVSFTQSGGGITAGTLYKTLNHSGNTFQFSTDGVTPINTTAGLVTSQSASWQDPGPTIFNQNVYLAAGNTNMYAMGNISAYAAGSGLQQRNGCARFNLIVNNPAGLNIGNRETGTKDATYNVILQGTDRQAVPAASLAEGISVRTVNDSGGSTVANAGPIIVQNNIVANEVSDAGTWLTISTLQTGVQVTNNIAFKWHTDIADSGSGNTTTPNTVDLAGTNAGGAPEPFSAPTRSVGSYHGTIGGTATLDAFLIEALLQSKANWRSQYMAMPVINYIRAGYDLSPVPMGGLR